jgi:hypothetical protein
MPYHQLFFSVIRPIFGVVLPFFGVTKHHTLF